MSITKAEILTFVNNVLHRSPAETNIDIQIQSVVDDLSQGPYIETSLTGQSLASSAEYISKPTGFFLSNSIILNDGTVNLPPLRQFPGGYKALRDQRGDAQAVTVSDPKFYAEFGSYLWIYPIPSKAYTYRFDYYKLHSAITDTLEFSDEWKRAIQFGAAFEVACANKLKDYIEIWGSRYADEKEKQKMAHPGPARIVGS